MIIIFKIIIIKINKFIIHDNLILDDNIKSFYFVGVYTINS